MDERTRIETINAVKHFGTEYRYLFRDPNGAIYLCTNKPRIFDDYHGWEGGYTYLSISRDVLPPAYLEVHWKDSLIDILGEEGKVFMDEQTRKETINALKATSVPGFRYLFKDENGKVYTCPTKPVILDDAWVNGGAYKRMVNFELPQRYLEVYWKDSLIDLCEGKTTMDEQTRIETIEAVKESASPGYRYLFRDKNGNTYVCTRKPTRTVSEWLYGGMYSVVTTSDLPPSYLQINWEDSLIELPEVPTDEQKEVITEVVTRNGEIFLCKDKLTGESTPEFPQSIYGISCVGIRKTANGWEAVVQIKTVPLPDELFAVLLEEPYSKLPEGTFIERRRVDGKAS